MQWEVATEESRRKKLLNPPSQASSGNFTVHPPDVVRPSLGGEKVANAHHILQTQVTILFAFENTVHSHTDTETAREAARTLTSMGRSNRV